MQAWTTGWGLKGAGVEDASFFRNTDCCYAKLLVTRLLISFPTVQRIFYALFDCIYVQ